MNKFFKTAVAAVVVGLGSQVHADVLIDDFTVSSALITAIHGTSASSVATDLSATCAHIIGCTRSIFIENNFANSVVGNASAETRFNTATPAIGDGYELAFNVDSKAFARATITWDGDANPLNFNAGGGIDKDFSTLSQLAFSVFSDGGSQGTRLIEIDILDTSGRKAFVQFNAFSTEGFGPDDYFPATFDFATEFGPNADVGFDWHHIGAVRGIVNLDGSTNSLDFALRQVTAVPEPGSLALAGLALLGLGAARRRKV